MTLESLGVHTSNPGFLDSWMALWPCQWGVCSVYPEHMRSLLRKLGWKITEIIKQITKHISCVVPFICMRSKLGAVFNSLCLPCRFLTECPGMFARQVPKVISFMKCKLACDIRLIKSLAYPNAVLP